MTVPTEVLSLPTLRAIATAEGYPLNDPAGPADDLMRDGAARRAGLLVSLLAAASLALIAASTEGPTQQRLLGGGAVGAGVGIFGTALTGACIPCGALVGLVVGTGAGHLYHLHSRWSRSAVVVRQQHG